MILQKNKLNSRQTVQIQIVKALEESKSTFLSEELKSRANIAANGEDSGIKFLEKRTLYLFLRLPAVIKTWTRFALLPEDWIKFSLIIPFILGVTSNYIGSSNHIHVIYNPLIILIVWNLFIYSILAFKTLKKFKTFLKQIKFLITRKPLLNDFTNNIGNISRGQSFFVTYLLGVIYKKFCAIKARLLLKNNDVKKALIIFWNSYENDAGNNLSLRFAALLNIGSVGLTLGALFGVFVRGIFYEYHFIWQSTFLNDVSQITDILNFILGPACIIVDGKLLTIDVVQKLISNSGAPAEPWIFRLSITIIIIIIIPRIILSIYYTIQSNFHAKEIDLSEDYFKNLFIQRKNILDDFRKGISDVFESNIEILADTIANFIVKEYYDKTLSPLLLSFKNKGGKLSDLETEIENSNIQFKTILDQTLEKSTYIFNTNIQKELSTFLGKKLDIDLISFSASSPNHNAELPNKVAEDISNSISVAITAAVTTTVATISGGLGQSLGIAIISGLLGVSGPIGMIIGGFAALLVSGGAYKINKKSLTNYIKNRHLPSFILFSINFKKIEKGRADIYSKIHEEIDSEISQKVGEVIEELINEIGPKINKFI